MPLLSKISFLIEVMDLKHSTTMQILLAVILLLIFTPYLQAQEDQNPPIRYRVVAVSKADSSIHSVSNEIELYLPLRIYFPSAFSPNGDGLNDTFGAVGEGIEKYRLTVYNRWGEVIFSSYDINTRWDGFYKGSPIPFGTYNYQVIAFGKEFGEIRKTGNVTVLN